MKRYTKNDLAFIQFVKDECKRLGVRQHIKDVQYVKLSPSIRCSGYFDDVDNILAASMGKEDGLSILVHEYCHLTQWVDGFHLWKKAGRAIPVIDEWLEGKYKRPETLNRAFEISIGLELDNEKRSVALMRKWNLDVDIGLYIQKANAYIQFYNYLGKTRRWSNPVNAPYGNETIRNAMPADFSMNYKKMGKRLEKLFENENI